MTVKDAKRLVRGCIVQLDDAAALADLVAGVDWSQAAAADPEVARIVGRVEGIVTLLAEGDLTRDEAEAELRKLLSSAAGQRVTR